MVVFGPEVVEGPLLCGHVGSWRPAGFLFEGLVHALVGAVFLRRSRMDPLMLDSEPKPPDVEVAQSVDAPGAEGGAIVGTDGLGQAEFAKGPVEDGPCASGGDVWQALAGQQESSVLVADGQREAPEAVLGGELALEVCGPQIVGLVGICGHDAGMLMFASPSSLGDQAFLVEQVCGAAGCGPLAHLGASGPEPSDELASTPSRVLEAGPEDQEGDLVVHAVRTCVRGVALVQEARQALLGMPLAPLVAGLPADAVALAQVRHGIQATVQVHDESFSLFHG